MGKKTELLLSALKKNIEKDDIHEKIMEGVDYPKQFDVLKTEALKVISVEDGLGEDSAQVLSIIIKLGFIAGVSAGKKSVYEDLEPKLADLQDTLVNMVKKREQKAPTNRKESKNVGATNSLKNGVVKSKDKEHNKGNAKRKKGIE